MAQLHQTDIKIDVQSETKPNRVSLLRFFSMESDTNNVATSKNYSGPEFSVNLCSKEFFLKIAQLLIGIICAGVYSEGVKAMTENVTSLTFPNAVFSAFIIITSVIIMSYMLGRIMPDILIRIFNAVGMVLYFTSATVTLKTYLTKNNSVDLVIPMKMLMIQVAMSYFNSFLYGLDMFFSIRKAIVFEI